MRIHIASVLALVLVLVASPLLQAQDQGASMSTAAEKMPAKRLLAAAYDKYSAQDFEGARAFAREVLDVSAQRQIHAQARVILAAVSVALDEGGAFRQMEHALELERDILHHIPQTMAEDDVIVQLVTRAGQELERRRRALSEANLSDSPGDALAAAGSKSAV